MHWFIFIDHNDNTDQTYVLFQNYRSNDVNCLYSYITIFGLVSVIYKENVPIGKCITHTIPYIYNILTVNINDDCIRKFTTNTIFCSARIVSCLNPINVFQIQYRCIFICKTGTIPLYYTGRITVCCTVDGTNFS